MTAGRACIAADWLVAHMSHVLRLISRSISGLTDVAKALQKMDGCDKQRTIKVSIVRASHRPCIAAAVRSYSSAVSHTDRLTLHESP